MQTGRSRHSPRTLRKSCFRDAEVCFHIPPHLYQKKKKKSLYFWGFSGFTNSPSPSRSSFYFSLTGVWCRPYTFPSRVRLSVTPPGVDSNLINLLPYSFKSILWAAWGWESFPQVDLPSNCVISVDHIARRAFSYHYTLLTFQLFACQVIEMRKNRFKKKETGAGPRAGFVL